MGGAVGLISDAVLVAGLRDTGDAAGLAGGGGEGKGAAPRRRQSQGHVVHGHLVGEPAMA